MIKEENQIQAKIESALADSKKPYGREEVVGIIRSVLATMETSEGSTVKIYQELDALAHYIENLRQDLAQSRAGEAGKHNIKSATDELDAVVGETEGATNDIMNACDKITAALEKTEGAGKDEILQSITSIYESCGFQDITGQRIKKVVRTLKDIETKVGEILDAIGHDGTVAADPKEQAMSLTNGPAIPGKAIAQDEIDRLLSDFSK